MNSVASAIVNLLCLGTLENTDYVISKAERKKFFLYLIDIVKNVDEKMFEFSIHTDQNRICVTLFFDENVRQDVRKLLKKGNIGEDVVKLEFNIFEAVKEDISVKDVKALAIKQFMTFITNSNYYSIEIFRPYIFSYKSQDSSLQHKDASIVNNYVTYRTAESETKPAYTPIEACMEILACDDVLIQDKIPYSRKHTQYYKFFELRTNDYKTVKTRDGLKIFYRHSGRYVEIQCVVGSALYGFPLENSSAFTTHSSFNSLGLKNNLSLLLSRKIKQIKFNVVDRKKMTAEIEFHPVPELFHLRIVDLDAGKPLFSLPLNLSSITTGLKVAHGILLGSSGFVYSFLSPDTSFKYQIDNKFFSIPFHSADLQQCTDFNFKTNSILQIMYDVIFDCIKCLVKKQKPPINCIISGAKRMPSAISSFFE